MEETPYHRLEKPRCGCFGRRVKKMSPEAVAERLDEATKTVEMKVRHLNYRMTKLHEEARALVADDKVMAGEKLRLRASLAQQHGVLVKFWGNLSQLRDQLSNAATLKDVSGAMEQSNALLNLALGDLDVHRIDEMMTDLDLTMKHAQDVGSALGDPLEEFDVDEELAAMIELPEVPVKKTKAKKYKLESAV